MTNKGVVESFRAESIISAVFIGINVRSFFNAAFDDLVHGFHPLLGNDVSTNLAFLSVFSVPFEQPKHGLLAQSASPKNRLLSAIPVHVASKAADVGFIDFDSFVFAAHLLKRALSHSEANPVIHEPC